MLDEFPKSHFGFTYAEEFVQCMHHRKETGKKLPLKIYILKHILIIKTITAVDSIIILKHTRIQKK